MHNIRPLNYFVILTLILLVSTLFFPAVSIAQMFSIGDPEPQGTGTPGIYTIAAISWEPSSFTYTGNENVLNDRVDFEDPVLRFRLETPGLELTLGLGGNLTGMNNNNYTNITGRIYNQFLLYRQEKINLFLPIQLTTDLTRVRSEDTGYEFQQSSFVFGSGLGSTVRLGERLDFIIRATPNYGFSFSQGNLFGGSLFRFDGRSYLIIRNVIGRRSIALGYQYDYRAYDVDGEQNDYDFTGHSFTLGIAF
jgi:hypothetical protein